MNYLVKTENYQLAANEREFLDKLSIFQKNLQKVLDTLVVTADETYLYLIALNKLTSRELNQLEPCVMLPSLLEQFVDKSLFQNNGYTLSQEVSVVSPNVMICIDNQCNVDTLIEAILEPFYLDGYLVEDGEIAAYVYINILDILEYQIVEEYIETWYPYLEIVSTTMAPKGFDVEKHISVKLAEVISDPVYLLNNANEIFIQYLNGVGDKSLYFIEGEQGRSPLSLFDVVALANMYGVNVEMHQGYAQVYGDYLAKAWFKFSPSEKTFVEFASDVFDAPSCVKISGLTDMLGVIDKVTVKVKAVNIQTTQEVVLEIHDGESITEVVDDYSALLKKDPRNIYSTLFSYMGVDYRWRHHDVVLSIKGQVYGVKKNVTMNISYNDKISLLHPFLGANAYYSFLKGKNYRPAGVPNKFQIYLARRICLNSTQIERLTMPAELIAFWKKENRDLSKALRLLQDIVTVDTLENLGQFSGRHGFSREKILLRLDQLGAV